MIITTQVFATFTGQSTPPSLVFGQRYLLFLRKGKAAEKVEFNVKALAAETTVLENQQKNISHSQVEEWRNYQSHQEDGWHSINSIEEFEMQWRDIISPLLDEERTSSRLYRQLSLCL